MINSSEIYEELKKTLDESSAIILTKVFEKVYKEVSDSIIQKEFHNLNTVVKELGEAQKKTEEAINNLTIRLEQLTARVDDLTEAQKRTEENLNKLIKRVELIEEQLGGLSMAVGYGLEDTLFPHIGKFLEKKFNIKNSKTELRKYIKHNDGKYDEVNIYTEGYKGENLVIAVSECKAQPGKKDIDKFMKMIERLKKTLNKNIIPYMVGYTFHPEIETYIKERYSELKYYKTYEIAYFDKINS